MDKQFDVIRRGGDDSLPLARVVTDGPVSTVNGHGPAALSIRNHMDIGGRALYSEC